MKIFSILTVLVIIVSVAAVTAAQRRDYMNEAEIELVRDSQDIDKRIEVLTTMIDRRFEALGINTGGVKLSSKSQEKWGDPPAGTHTELIWDIRQLLQKAIDDIDDVALHNENALTQNKTEGLLFPKAVRTLAAAASRYLPALKATLEKTKDDRERGLLLQSIDFCDQILEAVTKLPPEVKTEKKKKGTS